MIKLRSSDPSLMPSYATEASAACDLRAAESLSIAPGGHARVRTGVWIEDIDWGQVPKGMIPELQIRARSGLAFKYGIGLTNGIGTIDADYPDELCVLLSNHGPNPFVIQVGDRIAQVTMSCVHRIPNLVIGGQRQGGFGSTGQS